MYNETVLDHYRNPRNIGEIKKADGIGIYMSESCGDITKFWIEVDEGRIIDAKYKTQGCAASIACGSALTELAKTGPWKTPSRLPRMICCPSLVDYRNRKSIAPCLQRMLSKMLYATTSPETTYQYHKNSPTSMRSLGR